jgi:anthranilate phosphoribosyltransferase
MKHVAAARSSLGIPTIFNLLGPLTNPGRARHQLLGVFAPELTDRLATVLRALGSERAWVVHAQDGLDEISTMGPTRVSELRDGEIRTFTFDPASLGIEYARLSDLVVNSVAEAAEALQRVIAGEPGAKRDIAALNAAGALVVAEKAGTMAEGFGMAVEALESGRAQGTMGLLIECSGGEGR